MSETPLRSEPVLAHTPAVATKTSPHPQLLAHLSDRIHLPASIESLRNTYLDARPFPHLVMDDLFAPAHLDRLLGEIPPLTRDHFIQHLDDHQSKFGLRSAIELQHEGFQLASFLHSAAFLYLLSEITGIWGLVPDPYMQGGGYHIIPPGGKFDVHIDRRTDYATGLRRRLAFIIYLNHDWKPEYGGQLELWNADATRCEASIVPVFNRTILFEVADHNYHGHPKPVTTPDGRGRRSFLVYYHTVGEGKAGIDLRSSLFAPDRNATPKQKAKALARDLTPPALMRGIQTLRSRTASLKKPR